MRDVLCIYYSRTGNTKRVMETIAKEMDAELLALTDGVERSGLRGWLRSGMDAMRKDCPDVLPFETERKLENYRLVIIGTPVWAGRCSSVIRSFLKNHGGEMKRVAYVLTRGSEHKSEDIYRQMDQYTGKPHQAATSLRVGHVGHTFWQEEFLRQIRELLAEEDILAQGTCGAEADGSNVTWVLTTDGTLILSGTGAVAAYEERKAVSG